MRILKPTLLNILKKAHPIIGGKHTSCDNLVKGFPKHMRGKAKKVRDELIKNKIFESKPTSYGDKKECWINLKKAEGNNNQETQSNRKNLEKTPIYIKGFLNIWNDLH